MQVNSSSQIFSLHTLAFDSYKPIGDTRGGIFCGGGRGRLGKKGCNAPRATDFREERNPPQADSVGTVF